MIVNHLVSAELIQKYKLIYKELNPKYSQAIGEKVHFNMFGFKHANQECLNGRYVGLELLYLTPLSTIFHLYRGDQFYGRGNRPGVPGENH